MNLKCEDLEVTKKHENAEELLQKIIKYEDVFAVPTTLPPIQKRENCIHIEQTTIPISIRPYWYPQYQKIKIEILVKDMLKQGIIRPNMSPYSSLVILV